MVTLSQKELQRMRVIEKAVDGRLSVREAACLLQRSERQIQRLKCRYQPNSADLVRHGSCGQAKPWALLPDLRRRVLERARGKYAGFNDSHHSSRKKVSLSAARACAAFFAWPNGLLPRNAAPGSTVPVARDGLASA